MKSARTLFALAIIGLTVGLALLSLFWLPHDPSYASAQNTWLPPSSEHWLGTDGSGRDIASRLIIGSRVTVIVALGTVAFAGVLGLLLAIPQALGPRVIREPLAILIDVLIAFPTLLIAIMLTAVFGSSITIVVVAVGLGYGVQIARVVKAELRQVAGADYVLAARAAGLSRWRILTKHLIPGVSSVLFVQLSLSMGLAVLAESGLSYLGFGAPRDMPSWGTMLAETQRYIGVHPEVVLWPGLAITLVVLAFYLLGDVLRESLDPALHGNKPIARRTALGVQA
ncbi:ABC transporter permease [Leucobacter chinensis]|uniref:ABC transporter permease n=1 Tax=Leucobacter chinensis TaxID=2851010 RepID=UPI001C24D931|nr:ABC transporter permease [Leucobacter chinensis]